MDRRELVRVLREERVPDAFYDIPGVRDIPSPSDAYFFLRPAPDGWAVGLRQRSGDQDVRAFSSEDEACRELLGRLTTLPSPPPEEGTVAGEPAPEPDAVRPDAPDVPGTPDAPGDPDGPGGP
ncbi:hypothetical protein [Streptomyces xinghaiensis]|uniref:hypothetical protein n=1 Tax=Streptomyces xinghaiensis TaxID=1038928 RepID=UPI0002DBF80C|nr:hypothetical protein [Streptomyces xinghaiensis]